VVFSEMLPGPEQSWLADAAGNPYTAEMRPVFVDGQTRADLRASPPMRASEKDSQLPTPATGAARISVPSMFPAT
jgi:hypothetical protein